MAKIALLLLLAAVATAKPFGGAVVSQNHVSSSVMSPHLGLGYGMMYPGIGHSISSHSIAHVPHYGLGMGMLGVKGIGMGYPGIGYGYGGYGLMG